MGTIYNKLGGKMTLSAKVTRADGTVEDLGIIATTKPLSIFKRMKNFIKQILK